MRKIFFLIFLLFPFIGFAQKPADVSHYLSVPMVDGRIVFTHYVESGDLSAEAVYTKCLSCIDKLIEKTEMGEKNNYDGKAIFLAKDPSSGILTLRFDTPFSFKGTGLMKTKAKMSYMMNVETSSEGCIITIKNISYFYRVGDGTSERLTAEESIIDEEALNRDKTKLTNYYGNLRVATIDMMDSIFAAFDYAFE